MSTDRRRPARPSRAPAPAGSRGGAQEPDDPHARRLHEAFTKQAPAFEDARFNRVFTLDAAWLFETLDCGDRDMLLDVAAGTGLAARSLADRVRSVVAVDVTEAMLQTGKARADELGLRNVVFQRGDALALPFLPASFDVVVSRFAAHHVQQPEAMLAEMARCLRPGGRLALADMVADADADGELAAAQNRLERLRDPSHVRMLSIVEIAGLLERLGLDRIVCEAREIDRPVEPWLDQADPEAAAADAVRSALRAEIAGGEPTGFAPRLDDGELRFRQVWACLRARKPSS